MNQDGWYAFQSREKRHYLKGGTSLCGMVKGYHYLDGMLHGPTIPENACWSCNNKLSDQSLRPVQLHRAVRPEPLQFRGRVVATTERIGQVRLIQWHATTQEMNELFKHEVRPLVEWLVAANLWVRRY